MNRATILTLTLLYFSIQSFAQSTQRNWLVGGKGRFAVQKQELIDRSATGTQLQLSPNIGYFPIDKLAFGVRANYDYQKVTYGEVKTTTSAIGGGPFVRYYFLPVDKQVNLFAESAYQYTSTTPDNNIERRATSHVFSFSGGPVIYFNSSVGVEFTLNYDAFKGNANTPSMKTFSFGIGLQIHLERDDE